MGYISNLFCLAVTLQKLIKTTRQLIKHGKVKVTSVTEFTYMLLFSDVIVFAAPAGKNNKKLDLKDKIRLEYVWVDELKDTSSAENAWQLYSPDSTYLIQCKGKDDKQLWVDNCK